MCDECNGACVEAVRRSAAAAELQQPRPVDVVEACTACKRVFVAAHGQDLCGECKQNHCLIEKTNEYVRQYGSMEQNTPQHVCTSCGHAGISEKAGGALLCRGCFDAGMLGQPRATPRARETLAAQQKITSTILTAQDIAAMDRAFSRTANARTATLEGLDSGPGLRARADIPCLFGRRQRETAITMYAQNDEDVP